MREKVQISDSKIGPILPAWTISLDIFLSYLTRIFIKISISLSQFLLTFFFLFLVELMIIFFTYSLHFILCGIFNLILY